MKNELNNEIIEEARLAVLLYLQDAGGAATRDDVVCRAGVYCLDACDAIDSLVRQGKIVREDGVRGQWPVLRLTNVGHICTWEVAR